MGDKERDTCSITTQEAFLLQVWTRGLILSLVHCNVCALNQEQHHPAPLPRVLVLLQLSVRRPCLTFAAPTESLLAALKHIQAGLGPRYPDQGLEEQMCVGSGEGSLEKVPAFHAKIQGVSPRPLQHWCFSFSL